MTSPGWNAIIIIWRLIYQTTNHQWSERSHYQSHDHCVASNHTGRITVVIVTVAHLAGECDKNMSVFVMFCRVGELYKWKDNLKQTSLRQRFDFCNPNWSDWCPSIHARQRFVFFFVYHFTNPNQLKSSKILQWELFGGRYANYIFAVSFYMHARVDNASPKHCLKQHSVYHFFLSVFSFFLLFFKRHCLADK